MVTEVVKLTSKGQLTLPIALRKLLRVEKGSRLLVRNVGDQIIMSKMEDPLEELFSTLSQVAKEKGITREEILKTLKEVQKEMWAEEGY